ncbi:Rab-GAP TBC domain-containing protein [Aphelenchoides besseyi]|nr:Rab-GAP TBC domain-containing protein [Aphelenchoides besseyi]KAI6210634.1 Rab-GAP TBC domain-containing protein [Aphelenchoides besseyi]
MSGEDYDVLKVISSSSKNMNGAVWSRQRWIGANSVDDYKLKEKRRTSVTSTDEIGVSPPSSEFDLSFEVNENKRGAFCRRKTVDPIMTNNFGTTTRIRRRLIRQPDSVQSNDSAFSNDLCLPNEQPETYSQGPDCVDRLFNQISIDSTNSTDSHFESSPHGSFDNSFDNSNDGKLTQSTKMRSASIDSGYLDAASSVSSNHWSSEENDGLTVVDEDDVIGSRLSRCSSKSSIYSEFETTNKDAIGRLQRHELFYGGDFTDFSRRAIKRIIENIKKFVRHNDWPVSHEIRSDLWRVLCNYKDFETNKALYRRQLEELVKTGLKSMQPAFLSMDGIVVHDHGLKQQGAVALQRVLIVVECVRPELRFVPILYPLSAMLLHYMAAEEAFAAIMRFLGNGSNFLIQSDVSLYASFHTLLALLKKHRRSAYNFLKRRVGSNDDAKLAEVFKPWCEWIFKHLSFDYLVRIIDCYLVEGHKMLLRVALSLVYLWYKQRVRSAATASAGANPEERVVEIANQISVLCQNCPISVQTLLDMGFAIRNFKHSTFEHLQKHYEDKYREEVHRMRLETSGQAILQSQRNMYTAAFESNIIDSDSACELMCALPSRFQLETPVLLFRLSQHGASFTQLWTQIDEAEQSLIIIRSTVGEIFGAYCSASWSERNDLRERTKTRYFGTGESFVFKQPKGQLFPTIYPWVGRNNEQPDNCLQMFMTAGDKFMIIGSGGGDAIAIRNELTRGLSYECETFGNAPLVANTEFEIDELEVFKVIGAGGV